jgi:hypothetical protein
MPAAGLTDYAIPVLLVKINLEVLCVRIQISIKILKWTTYVGGKPQPLKL